MSAAKALRPGVGRPFVGVNHLEGHLHAAFLEDPDIALPAVVLLVSGGHTLLILMAGRAATACWARPSTTPPARPSTRWRGSSASATRAGRPSSRQRRRRPRGHRRSRGVCATRGTTSPSAGLKTAVVTYVRKHPEVATADVAASFQEAVVDVLVDKDQCGPRLTSGPVGLHRRRRRRQHRPAGAHRRAAAQADGRPAFLPSRAMCTDNAAMVGATGLVPAASSTGPRRSTPAADPNLRLPLEALSRSIG